MTSIIQRTIFLWVEACGSIKKTLLQSSLIIVITLSFGFIKERGIFTPLTCTPLCIPIYDANMETPTIINLMRNMRGNRKIPLEEVHQSYPTITKLYRGRPEMVVMTMKNGRNLQMFRGGVVQILGRVSDTQATEMLREFVNKLQQINTMQHFQISKWTVSNLVMSVQLKKSLRLHRIQSTKADIFYEVEIFPASLIEKWQPVHIAAFNNGKIILTGLKSFEHFHNVMSDLSTFLKDCNAL